MIELRLGDALHASAAAIDPMPKLAAFGVALTEADRTHRRRAVAAVATVAAAACVAGVAVAQTSDASSRSVDVAPAQRTGDGTYDGPPDIKINDPKVVPTEVVVAAPESSVPARPTYTVPDPTPPAPTPTDGGGAPPAPPVETFSATSAYGSGGGSAPYDYYSGVAPAGQTVTASSPKGSGSVVADGDGHWALKVYFYAVTSHPPGTTFTVTLSTPGQASKTFSFTYTGP